MIKKATRAQVAQAAGVAESTVSRALNDSSRISAEVKKRVQKIADELGYIPNRQAVLLTSQKTFSIGLVVRAFSNISPFTRAYFSRLLDGVVQKAEDYGYSITILLDKKNDQYKDLNKMVKSREVDGLIFSVTSLNDSRFPELIQNNIPMVLVNNQFEGISSINCDPRKGTETAVNHLRDLGHKKIAYISGDPDYYDGMIRLESFKKIVGESSDYPIAQGNFSKSSGYRATSDLFNQNSHITAIMTASDREAMGVLNYCNERGINVPDDLSLIGFDNLGPAGDMTPRLTSIENPVTRMGSEAVNTLMNIIDNNENWKWKKLDSQLILRHSTAKAN